VCVSIKQSFPASKKVERYVIHFQQDKPFCSGDCNIQSQAVPPNHYWFYNYRASSGRHGSMEGSRGWPEQHLGPSPMAGHIMNPCAVVLKQAMGGILLDQLIGCSWCMAAPRKLLQQGISEQDHY
jgi:hypothetical protein